MTKISEAIKYYESIIKQVGIFIIPAPKYKLRCDRLGEPDAASKLATLTLIQEAIGDADLSEEYFEVLMYGLKSFPFKTPYERKLQKIRTIYDLSQDTKMTTEEFLILIQLYHSGAYSLMSEEIKELISTHKDIKSGLKLIIAEAIKYGLEESKKLECLKEEYGKEFIEKIQKIIKEECISSDKVIEILPSKSFIDASVVEVPGLGCTIVSGEDIVLRRLKYARVESDYQTALADEKVALGFSSTGDIVYTSFTKGEYEEDFKSGKKLIRKK